MGRVAVLKPAPAHARDTSRKRDEPRLTERGFSGTPPILGDVVRTDASGESATIAIVQGFVTNQGDGWQWTLDRLDRLVDEGATPFGDKEEDGLANYTPFATRAGERIGEMHAVLAQPTDDPAFAPVEATAKDADAIASASRPASPRPSTC